MSKIRKLGEMIRARWTFRHFTIGRRVRAGPGIRLGRNKRADIRFGDRVHLGEGCGLGIQVGDPTLIIGRNTYLQPRSRINVSTRIEIGEDCAISWDVDIMDTDFHGVVNLDGSTPSISAPIFIGDRVWIGAGSKILKGARIEHDSVVAAGSIVTRSFPPHSLIAGVPARRIREIRGWTP